VILVYETPARPKSAQGVLEGFLPAKRLDRHIHSPALGHFSNLFGRITLREHHRRRPETL